MKTAKKDAAVNCRPNSREE